MWPNLLYIDRIEVNAGCRGRGIGSRALAYFIRFVGRDAGIVVVKPWPLDLKRDKRGNLLLEACATMTSPFLEERGHSDVMESLSKVEAVRGQPLPSQFRGLLPLAWQPSIR